ncbi:hypothetical protein BpHYR1_045527 [Brachionus plicatilis]|uniref:Uncharacterized protein n=1 Tax=Brachionus plicatilis TaxID=10195 RepID=A0A3M7PHS6_BRAPC|nr:hypothetical protein BpHYR1_045527 [Brachionus plicatilis]
MDSAGIIERVRNPDRIDEADEEPPVAAGVLIKAVILCTQLSDLIHKFQGSEQVQALFDLLVFLRNRRFEASTNQSTISFKYLLLESLTVNSGDLTLGLPFFTLF